MNMTRQKQLSAQWFPGFARSAVAWIVCVSTLPVLAQTPRYVIRDDGFGRPGDGIVSLSMNNSQQVCGYQFTNSNNSRGFLFSDRTFHDVLMPDGSLSSGCVAINNLGAIIGGGTGLNGGPVAFLWYASQATPIELPAGSIQNTLNAINDSNDVVGTTWSANGSSRAVMWRNGVQQLLPVYYARMPRDEARAINNHGMVVGTAGTELGFHVPAVWQGNRVRNLGTFGGTQGWATDVNDAGQVVGFAFDSAGMEQAFIWQGAGLVRITPNSPFSLPRAISSDGTVVGGMELPSGRRVDFWYRDGQLRQLSDLIVSRGFRLNGALCMSDSGEILASIYWGDDYLLTNVRLHPISSTDCTADVDNGSGLGLPDDAVTIDDLYYYLRIFEEGWFGADIDDGSMTGTVDGDITIDDLVYFLRRFQAGC